MEKEKILIISPTAGFGNRIRTICGSLIIANMCNRKCYVLWDIEETNSSNFASIINTKQTKLSQYFDVKNVEIFSDTLNIIPDICYSEWLPGQFWYEKPSYGQKKLNPTKTFKYNSTVDLINDRSDIILLETSYILKFENVDESLWKNMLSSSYKHHFKINNDKYQKILDNIKYDVGISIRRGEFLNIYPETNVSVEDISRWIKDNFKDLKVVIFSDDHEFRDQVREKTSFISDPIINDVSWEKGFMEFLVLSNCNSIYGTPLSSFSEEAALFGEKQYNTLPTIFPKSCITKKDYDLSKNELYTLGNKYNTDKVTHHGYHRYYQRYLENFKNVDDFAMIEIGIDESKSLNMWLEYFPLGFIYGVDIGKSLNGDRHLVYQANQNDIKELIKLHNIIIKNNKNVLFICDDGSHLPTHIFNTFNYMFKDVLLEGGIYIIEDIETSYWKNKELYTNMLNYGYHHKESVIEVFKGIVDTINNEFLNDENKKIQSLFTPLIKDDVINMISTITFCHNCIIIVKKEEYEYKYLDREYRFKSNL